MLIGVDFDNTIICYDRVFHRIGREWDALAKEIPALKNSVREHLIQKGQNDLWTELQGYVYGHGITEAEPFPGVMDFFLFCRKRGFPVCIVSHKTEFPKRGNFRANLREAAMDWLEKNGFFDTAKTGLTPARVYFEPTRSEKNRRIGSLGVTHFIDDLVEVFNENTFPSDTKQILFLPHNDRNGFEGLIFKNWPEIKEHFARIDLSMNDSDAFLLANRLAPGGAKRVERLGNSGNSRVYHVESFRGRCYAAKFYLFPTAEGRERLDVEVRALDFLHRKGLACIPQPIVWDRAGKVVLLEYIDGHPLSSYEVTEADMEEMAGFLVQLKGLSGRTPYEDFYPASEAWFSAAAGERNILKRLEDLETVEGDGPVFNEYRRFLKEQLRHALEEVLGRIRRDMGKNSYEVQLDRSARTLSPSDFGVHNCLRRPDGGLSFLDFEYFGWDDPAKMISDFLLHPRMNLSHELKIRFFRTVLEGFNHDKGLPVRLEMFYPLCGLKWCTILLNEFRNDLFAQRRFAAEANLHRHEVLLSQLNKSERMLENVMNNSAQFPYL